MKPVPETEAAFRELAAEGNRAVAATVLILGERAKEIVPECVGLSLGMIEDGLTFTLVATSDEQAVLDAVQYLDGGPCVAAAQDEQPQEVNPGDALDEGQWAMFARASAAAGIASTLSLPIVRDGKVVVSVNLYASTPDAFVGRQEELAEALGASAEGAVSNADLEFSTRRKAAQAPGQLADQRDIDIAVGIIAESQDVDTATARERLLQAAARAGITEGQAARALKHLRNA